MTDDAKKYGKDFLHEPNAIKSISQAKWELYQNRLRKM